MDTRWSVWWVLMWALIFGVLVTSLFLVPFRVWSVMALVLFGIPEAIGLRKGDDRYPPLTEVIQRYVPSWAWFPAMYGLLVGAAAHWLGFAYPWRMAAIGALLGWLTEHFDK